MGEARVYEYGAKAPRLELAEVERQMREAHRYKNELVAIENNRRKQTEALVREYFPRLLEIDAHFEQIEAQIEDIIKRTKQVRKQTRTRVTMPDADKTALAALKAVGKALNIQRKAERLRAFGPASAKELRKTLSKLRGGRTRKKIVDTPEILAVRKQLDDACAVWFAEVPTAREFNQKLEDLNAEFKQRNKNAYHAFDMFWGTKLAVHDDLKLMVKAKEAPQFKRWNGDGRISVQLQLKRDDEGEEVTISPDDLHAGNCTHVQMPRPDLNQNAKRKKCKSTVCRMRIGTNEDNTPRWAEFSVYMHRPLPPDAKIKGARLLRHRLASKCRWKVQFILARDAGWERPDRASEGVVGIDVGWRILPEGLRVAYWAGDDGASGQLVIPSVPGRGWDRVEQLRSYRDTNFNLARELLKKQMEEMSSAPAWLVELTENMSAWKNQGRLANVANRWEQERFDGDHAAFTALLNWKREDSFAWEEERNLADKLLTNRRELYRVFARTLARRYKTAVLEAWDLRQAARCPTVEEKTKDAVRARRTEACISNLRLCLANSGLEIQKTDPAGTTMTCVHCAHVYDFDRMQLHTECPSCGRAQDQDHRAALNLLHAGMHPAGV